MSRSSRLAFVLLLGSSLAACASPLGVEGGKRAVKVVGHSETTGMDPIATAAFWGTRYDREPTNPDVAVAFSRSLRAIENNEESLRVIKHAHVRIGDQPAVLLELGKSLIANDRPHEAVRPIERSIALGLTEDWSAYSAWGVALDRVGEHKAARVQYDRALSLAPDKAQILNNKGLSFALDGNRLMAEKTLRTATAAPDGTARIRQNFALVLALAGNKSEAERLARSDLPPALADNNVRYFRNLVAQPVYWQGLDPSAAELPQFDDEPAVASTTLRAKPIPEPVPSPTPGRIRPPERATPAPADTDEPPENTPSAEEVLGDVRADAATGAPQALAF